MQQRLSAVVLAGQRSENHPLAAHFRVPLAVLTPLAGVPLVTRVVQCLQASRTVGDITLCGPSEPQRHTAIATLLDGDVRWMAPAKGPSLSVAAALEGRSDWPLLVTTGDHGLLQPEIVDWFGERVLASDADVLVGVASYAAVMDAFPDTRRTRLGFADDALCGCNLFAFRTPAAAGVVKLWRRIESERKRPWRVMSLLGTANVARYLAGRLTLERALTALSARAGCRIEALQLPFPAAAVDVDSVADWQLAERILSAGAEVTQAGADTTP